MECLDKVWEKLLAFYDYPAEHWVHIRNIPTESNFATVRLRSWSCGFRATTVVMVFKLLQSAQNSWKLIKRLNKLELVVKYIKFQDGVFLTDKPDSAAA